LYDAHNHLADARFGEAQAALLMTCLSAGVTRMVVNGTCESDWPQVLALAQKFPAVLIHFLDAVPSAIGEIGLDRWKPALPYEGQEDVFVAHLRLAAERNLPVSIHCLQAWGRLLELLQAGPLPRRGFLLHSYGGPAELVPPLAKLGAYFSFPGYYAQESKARQRDTFRQIPLDRLLIETDAPDQRPPDALIRFPLTDTVTGQPLNHPANLGAIYDYAAELRGLPPATFAAQVEQNFLRLFADL